MKREERECFQIPASPSLPSCLVWCRVALPICSDSRVVSLRVSVLWSNGFVSPPQPPFRFLPASSLGGLNVINKFLQEFCFMDSCTLGKA